MVYLYGKCICNAHTVTYKIGRLQSKRTCFAIQANKSNRHRLFHYRMHGMSSLMLVLNRNILKTRALLRRRPPLPSLPHVAQILDLVSQHDDSDHPQNLIYCSLYHCRTVLKISSESTHNL